MSARPCGAPISICCAAGSVVTGDGKPSAELVLLNEAIRAVIADAIAAGGSSLRDHIQTDGSLGYFQHSFSVYDREGAPCATPGCRGHVERIAGGALDVLLRCLPASTRRIEKDRNPGKNAR